METVTQSSSHPNLTTPERWISLIGGGFLTVTGLEKRSIGGALMALAGAELLRRGVTGHSYLYCSLGIQPASKRRAVTSVPHATGIRLEQSITINRPRQELFRIWRDFRNLPRFMENIESLEVIDWNRSHWIVKGPAGRRLQWDAVIHNEVENERIAWRSLAGADVDNAGSVLFHDVPGGRGAVIKVELLYHPPAGPLSAAFAKLLGDNPDEQLAAGLHRLKQMLETGRAHTMLNRDQAVDEASEESFPASDAPSYHP